MAMTYQSIGCPKQPTKIMLLKIFFCFIIFD